MKTSITADLSHSTAARVAAAKSREVPFTLENFSKLPAEAYTDIKTVAGLYGSGVSTVWAKLKRGEIPKPRKFGRSTRWNVGQLRAALAEGS